MSSSLLVASAILWWWWGGQFRPSHTDALILALAGDGQGALEAFQALDHNTDPDVCQHLVSGLSSSNARVRMICARLLSHLDQVDCASQLQPLLDDDEPNVRAQAARSYVLLGENAKVQAIIADRSQPVRVRSALIGAMTAEELVGTQDVLEHIAADTGEGLPLRVDAVAQLRYLTGERTERVMWGLVNDPFQSVELRTQALMTLGYMSSPHVADRLLRFEQGVLPWQLHDAALEALGRTRDIRALPVLEKYALDGEVACHTRDVAIWALGLVRQAKARTILLALLHNDSAHVRGRVADVFASLCDRPDLPSLRAALRVEIDAMVIHKLRCAIERQNQCREGHCVHPPEMPGSELSHDGLAAERAARERQTQP